MDRRQQKTRKLIFSALATLLEVKSYNEITVQDIIDEANIGRSTFYSHFTTKDSLLNEMCSDIFEHVFSNTLEIEKTHNFSNTKYSLCEQMTHILYHLKDNGKEIFKLLKSESGDLFLNILKGYLPKMFEPLIKQSDLLVPMSYVKSFLIGSFANTIMWWVDEEMKTPPELVAKYYFSIINNGMLN